MNYKKIITKKLQNYSSFDLNILNIKTLEVSNFFILDVNSSYGVLKTNYKINKDILLIDLINSNDIILMDNIFKEFNFKNIYQIINDFSKNYNLLNIITDVKVSKLYFSHFLNGNIEISLKFNFIINNIKVNVLFEKNKFKINYFQNSKKIYINKNFKSFLNFLEFITFKIYFKNEYKIKRFSNKNFSLIKLLRY